VQRVCRAVGANKWGERQVYGRRCECGTTHAPRFVYCMCLGKASVAQGHCAVCADAATCPFLALHFGHPLLLMFYISLYSTGGNSGSKTKSSRELNEIGTCGKQHILSSKEEKQVERPYLAALVEDR
jgi:hypothetical protein